MNGDKNALADKTPSQGQLIQTANKYNKNFLCLAEKMYL